MVASIKKSGVNLHLQLIGETYDASRCGQIEVGVSQVALSSTTIPCFQVLVQASNGNSQDVIVGNLTDGCYLELQAGASITIPYNDVNKIYVRAESGTQIVNWMAMT